MPSSRTSSPARSQGSNSASRQYKLRGSRSVGSPAHSSSSIKLSSMIQMNSFALSPMHTQRSVLTDTTEIDMPRRQSWWKKLDENSREIMDALNNKDPAEVNNAIEEYIDVDVLSQEKKNYTMDLPESSDGESINSIIIPQKKLFVQKESKPQKKFAQIIDNRESLAPLYKTQMEVEKTLKIGRKNLFNQGTKTRTKPLFPSALLNTSSNYTIANKTKELVNSGAKTQVKSLFSNRPGIKRKNMFANFIASDSEEEIPEIQPKVFGFQKKVERNQRQNSNCHEARLTSPTSSMTDIEMDEWKLLPSSTMVDQQLEDGLRTTPSKRARLTKLSEGIESINTESNVTTNKTNRSNKSVLLKRKSKNLSQFKEMEVNELMNPINNDLQLDVGQEKTKSSTKNESQRKSLREFNKSKNASVLKTIYNETNDKLADTSKNNRNKSLSNCNEIFQNEDDEDFSLVYENDDNDEVHNDGNSRIIHGESRDPNEASKVSKFSVTKNVNLTNELQRKSKSFNTTHQPYDKDNNDIGKFQGDRSNNNCQDNFQTPSINEKGREISKSEINDLLHLNNIENEGNKSLKNKKDEKQVGISQNSITKHIQNPEPNIYNMDLTNRNHDHEHDDHLNCENGKDAEDGQELVNEEINPVQEVYRKDTSGIVVDENLHSNGNDLNFSQNEENYSEENIQDHCKEGNKLWENIDNLMNEREKANNTCVVEREQNNLSGVIKNIHNEDNRQDKEITCNEKRRLEVHENLPLHDEIENEIINNDIKSISKNHNNIDVADGSNESTKEKGSNLTLHNNTSRHREKKDNKIHSPEVILHDKPSQMESFTVQGRNTSIRKTKSVIKNLTIRPSLAPVRESIDLSNGSRNSSIEGSGWDSHRTTRRTLRQTFGKDFTPRKSLRTLVMEKSAKRHSNFNEMNTEFSRFPQANSTELPGCVPLAMDQSEVSEKSNDVHDNVFDGSGNAHKLNTSHQEALVDIDVSEESKEIRETNHDFPDDNENAQQIDKMVDSEQEMSDDCNYNDKQQNNYKLGQSQETNDFDVEHETNDQGILRRVDNSEEEQKYNESDRAQENNESDQIQENNDSDDEYEMDESNGMTSQQINHSDEALNDDESDHAGENIESDNSHEVDETEQELTANINNSDNSEHDDDSQEIDDSGQEDLDINKADDESTTNNFQEVKQSSIAEQVSESTVAQEINNSYHDQDIDKSDDELEVDIDDAQENEESDDARDEEEADYAREEEESDDAREEDESGDAREEDDSDDAREEDESDVAREEDDSDKAREENDCKNNHELIEPNRELSFTKDHMTQQNNYDHEHSRNTRQTTLEMYLQKVKDKNLERKKQLEDEIRKSLKAPSKDILNPFKVPAVPKLRRVRTQPTKPKAKVIKSSVIPLNLLPVEVLEDLKYKPPKRYRPTNASWITKRLYKYLETKLETKYDYKARIRSEKLVETIYNFTKDIRRHSTAPPDAVDALKHEMARLNVVKTHFEFYEFFHEYMPREVRVKVVPDLFNKISLPKYGVFSDIL